MWNEVAPRLAEAYRVLNIEFRGHDESTAPERFALDDLVDDWLAVLDAEQVERAAVVGLSLGGMTALRMALRAPERVGALVLLDSRAGKEPWLNRLKYGFLRRRYRRDGISDFLVQRLTPLMFGRTTLASSPELIDAFVQGARRHDREQLDRAIGAVVGRDDAGPIEKIDCPTLVLVGEQDVATPPQCSREMQRRIPAARLVTIPDAGHLSAMERPDRVADETLRFLGNCSW
jgi:pimeloyl-ACP methyl ester carboxylesterase